MSIKQYKSLSFCRREAQFSTLRLTRKSMFAIRQPTTTKTIAGT